MELIGTIISILVGLTTLLTLLVWCGKFIQKVSYHEKKLDEQGKNIDRLVHLVETHDHRISSMQDDVVEVKRDLSILKNDFSDLRVAIASINGALSLNLNGMNFSVSGKHSPRTLTEIGEKIYKDMNGENFLQKNKDELFAYIDRSAPKTAYDVENEARMACLSKVSTDMFIEIKSFLYNYSTIDVNGRPYEVTLLDACSVLSLPLRDMYLDAHPNIIR